MIVMGSSAICGGMLSLLLPETLGTQLPDTLEDTENFKKNDKGFFQCWSSATLKARTDDSNFGKKHWCNWEILIQLKIYLRSLKYRNPVKEVCNIAMWPASQPFHRSELLKICYKFLLKILGDWKIIYEWWIMTRPAYYLGMSYENMLRHTIQKCSKMDGQKYVPNFALEWW